MDGPAGASGQVSPDVVLTRTVIGGLLVDLDPGAFPDLVASLERARTRLYDAEAAPEVAEVLGALDDAHVALGVARRLASASAALDELRERLLPRLERLVLASHDHAARRAIQADRARSAPAARQHPFRASLGVPTAHHVDRGVIPASYAAASLPPLEPAVDDQGAADEDDEDPELAEDDAIGRSPFRRRLPVASGGHRAAPEVDELHRLARDRLEEIAIASHLRRPTPRHAWTVAAAHEDRLLENLDALAALGIGRPRIDVVRVTAAYAQEVALDVGRVFAWGIVVGSLAGADAADVTVASLGAVHATTRRALVDALSLAGSPDVARAARAELLRQTEAPTLAALLEVLRRRREADLPSVAPFTAHPSPDVRAEAVRALALGPVAGAALVRLLEDLLDRHDDTTTRRATAEALAIRGSRRGADAARAAVSAAREPADASSWAQLLAVIGEPADLDRLLEVGARVPAALPHLGWLGHPGAFTHLVDALAREATEPRPPGGERRPLQAALASALDRLLGAELDEELVGDDRLGNEGVGPTVDPSRWRGWWRAHGGALDPRLKIRAGAPWTPRASLDELDAATSFPADRALATLELAVALGPEAWVDTAGWAARQELATAAIRARGAALDADPGAPAARRLRRPTGSR